MSKSKKNWLLAFDPNTRFIHFSGKAVSGKKYISNHKIEWFPTKSELEGFVTENNLISKTDWRKK